MRTWGGHIGKHATRSTEHIVLNLNAFVDGDVVLYTHMVANLHIVAHIYVLSERAAFTYHCTRLDMAEMPNLCPFANAHVVVNVTAFVYLIVIHSNLLYFMFGPSTSSGALD